MTSRGNPGGPQTPYQLLWSKPGRPDSAIEGMSGAAPVRFAVVTASARSLPLFTNGIAEGVESNIICTCPPITSVRAGVLPL